MSIHEFTDEQFPEESGNNTNMDGLDLIFKLIALLASGFSGYTTYLGFDYDFPKLMAITLAVMVGLGLLMINFKLRQSRIVGESVGKILLALLFVLPFSFISNTNAIYTFFMEKDVVEKTQIEAWKNFDAGTSKLLAAIEDHEISIKVA
ncbi:MAG: hypothetical protein AAF669_07650 [Pseudomonadota bacterium]